MRTADISYTSTIGNAMSNTVINGGNLGDVLRSGRDTATDTNTLKNTLTSGLSAGITKGITEYLDKTNSLTKGIISKGNTTLNPNATITQQFTSKLVDSATSNITSTAIQSTINGDSFTEALKHQAINTIVMAGADYAANQIGQQYHTNGFSDNNAINKATQLTLHAGLGALANGLTGNDMLSGAISGVVGELTGEYLKGKGYNKQDGSEIAGLTSAISSLITGKVQDLDTNDIRDNVYSGYRVGKNASENNNYFEDTINTINEYSDYKNNMDNIYNGYYSDESYSNEDILTGNNENNENDNDILNVSKLDLGDNINTLFTFNSIADSIPTITMPNGLKFMDPSLDYGVSWNDGLTFNTGLTFIDYTNNYGENVKFFDFALGGYANPKTLEFGFNIGLHTIKMGVEQQLGNKTIEVTVGQGAGANLSNKGIGGGTGFTLDINIKDNNGNNINIGTSSDGKLDTGINKDL